jgi:hypothetical protein
MDWNVVWLSNEPPARSFNVNFVGKLRVSMLSAPPAKLAGMSGDAVLLTVRLDNIAAGNRSSGAEGTSGSGLGSTTPLSVVSE